MVDTIEFEALLIRKKCSKRELAKKIGITEQALYNKINNVTEFKASELYAISKILKIPIDDKIFFNNVWIKFNIRWSE